MFGENLETRETVTMDRIARSRGGGECAADEPPEGRGRDLLHRVLIIGYRY